MKPWLKRKRRSSVMVWSFVKTVWLLCLNGVMAIYAWEHGGGYGQGFAVAIVVTGVFIIIREIFDE